MLIGTGLFGTPLEPWETHLAYELRKAHMFLSDGSLRALLLKLLGSLVVVMHDF
jgi:hypothetical protein